MDDNSKNLEKELSYYRKKTDELAGENLKLDYTISGLRHELKQRKEGFALLSSLHSSLGLNQNVDDIFKTIINAVNSTLGMDKSMALMPTGGDGEYRPSFWLGSDLNDEALSESIIKVPKAIEQAQEVLICNKGTARDDFATKIEMLLGLPYFICSAIQSDGKTIGIIVSGRMREAKPLYPPLDRGDADTFIAIGGLVSSIVEAMKVATLKETDRLKTEFFANLSHEFRTPITLTMGPLEAILTNRYGEVSDKLKKEVETMLRNQKRLLGLINQILDLAKLESGAMNLKVHRVADINHFLKERLDQFENLAEKRGIKLIHNFDADVSSVDVYFDLEKIDKVIFNLLSNSIKFTKKGHVELLTKKISEQEISVEIQDTGVGIKADQLPYIFDRFRQADGSSTRDFAGTGIGLALVKEIVELHSGKISVTSEYGKGTRMVVNFLTGSAHFPAEAVGGDFLNIDSALSSPLVSQAVEINEGHASTEEFSEVEEINIKALNDLKPFRPKVIYVDDNKDLRSFVHNLLVEEFNVFLAVNGKDGFEKAKKYSVDLILSDLMMPVWSGADFLSASKNDNDLKNIPFVLLTARSDLESKVGELERGADDYLNKPFSEKELMARVRNLIKIREQQRYIKKELRAARGIQQALLPPHELKGEHFNMEILYKPCEDLSGDFFDFQYLKPHLYFYIADVMGHGTASAQVTYIIKSLVQNLLQSATSKTSLSSLLYQMAKGYSVYKLEYMVGIQLCRFNTKTGVCEYVSSNTPQPILVSSDGKTSLAQVSSNSAIMAETFSENTKFQEDQFQILPGQHVYFCTDGAYEFPRAIDSQEFGMRRLCHLLKSQKKNSWRQDFIQALTTHHGSQDFPDDMTVLRLDYT